MKFIKLTSAEDDAHTVVINMARAIMTCPYANRNTENGSKIFFNREDFEYVRESPEEIMELINADHTAQPVKPRSRHKAGTDSE